MSDILDASRGRPVKSSSTTSNTADTTEQEPQAGEHESGSSREWVTHHAASQSASQGSAGKAAAAAAAEQVQNGSDRRDTVDEKAVQRLEQQATTTNEQLSAVSQLIASVPRSEGALTDEAGLGKDVEVVHDLLLVALGLGQYRASDGATTLFESDSVFDSFEPNTGTASKKQQGSTSDDRSGDMVQEPLHGAEQSQDALTSQLSTPSPDALPVERPQQAEQSTPNVGSKTWTAISGGAITGWRGVSGAAKDSANFLSGAKKSGDSAMGTPADVPRQEKSTKKAPTKPNDPFRYDARARALIWVATLSMGIDSREITGAEKVMAQSVYFIMEEGRSRAQKEGKSDPLVEAKMLKAASTSSTSDEAANARKDWMNRASERAVTKERSKANWGKWAATGAGFAIGGVAIGLTGGLAAPFVLPALAGLTGVGFLATTGGVVMMGTLLGESRSACLTKTLLTRANTFTTLRSGWRRSCRLPDHAPLEGCFRLCFSRDQLECRT